MCNKYEHYTCTTAVCCADVVVPYFEVYKYSTQCLGSFRTSHCSHTDNQTKYASEYTVRRHEFFPNEKRTTATHPHRKYAGT